MRKLSKLQDEYNDVYGEIPASNEERLAFIKNQVKTDRAYAGKLEQEITRIKGIKWSTLDFTFYLVPKPTPRPRLDNGKHHFYVQRAADNKRFFKEYLKEMQDIPTIITPCKFYCTSYLPTPKGMGVLEQLLAELGLLRPIKKPDFDNLVKTYSDMITGTVLFDDSLIIEGVSKKYYSVKPRIEITVKYMEDFDSEFNRKHMLKKIE